MDWNGDHPHTNFRSLHGALRRAGFHVEALAGNFSSFDASRYGALLLVDPEEPYHPAEARKLVEDVTRRGLGLLVAADWHDPALMRQAHLPCIAPVSRLHLAYISPTSRLHLPYISHISPLSLPYVSLIPSSYHPHISPISRLYLACISPVSRLYLACISPVSPLYLPCISLPSCGTPTSTRTWTTCAARVAPTCLRSIASSRR